MSDQVEQRLVTLMSQPEFDPYGNPIPGADGTLTGAGERGRALANTLGQEPIEATLTRIGEPLQVDVELMADLQQAGVIPGATIRVERGSDKFTIGADGGEHAVDLPMDTARHLFVG